MQTLHRAGEFRDLRRFLVCILFYQAGIMAVIALAAIYAQEAMKFTSQQTIVLVLVVNITAAIGAFGFGYLQDAIGHIKAMTLVLVGWIIMIALAIHPDETRDIEALDRHGWRRLDDERSSRAPAGTRSPRLPIRPPSRARAAGTTPRPP